MCCSVFRILVGRSLLATGADPKSTWSKVVRVFKVLSLAIWSMGLSDILDDNTSPTQLNVCSLCFGACARVVSLGVLDYFRSIQCIADTSIADELFF